jgi:hypothetical protein
MITDALLVLSGSNTPGAAIDGQALTTGNILSTDKISLATVTTATSNGTREIGSGMELYVLFTVTEAFVGGTSVDFTLVTDDNASISSPTTIASTGTILTAALAAGRQYVIRIPNVVGSIGEQFLAARYVISGTYSAGKVLTQVVLNLQDGKKFYPRNDNP